MRDVLVLVITVAFFLLCVAYVRWCDRIIGPDEALEAGGTDERTAIAEHEVAA